MPASLFTDMNSGGLEDHRALQIALELSLLGLNPDDREGSPTPISQFDIESHKMRKSANTTECVPVPSSEHVAEIVGRQGCKIKALRAKTNTYIKTPVRGEEPVFVVTGRREDVQLAKREIISAAEHFSQIRASRRNTSTSGSPGSTPSLAPGPPSPTAGQVTIQVRVPYRVVGLVVGPKGATIKRIQQQTHTYIVTPSRDKEPVFEVTGLVENVEKARVEIESHIATRTGGLVDGAPVSPPGDHDIDFHNNGYDSGFQDLVNSELISTLYKPTSTTYSPLTSQASQDNNIFTFPVLNGSSKIGEFTGLNGFSSNGFNLYDNDEGIGSPSFDSTSIPPSPMWPDTTAALFGTTNTTTASFHRRIGSISNGTTPRLSPTLTDSNEHASVRRIRSDPLNGGISSMSAFSPLPNSACFYNTATSGSSLASSASTSPTDSTGSLRRKICLVCGDGDITAALVPCGHNLFCMECANLIVGKSDTDRRCPVCQQAPTQAIRIFS